MQEMDSQRCPPISSPELPEVDESETISLGIAPEATDPPLNQAAWHGRSRIVQELLVRGDDPNVRDKMGVTPLQRAARNGHDESVRFLLEHGANVNYSSHRHGSALVISSRSGHAGTVQMLLAAGAMAKSSALHVAAQFGHEAITEMLIKAGANVRFRNSRRVTVLHVAASSGNANVLRQVLKTGASRDVSDQDFFGATPLYDPAVKAHEDVSRLLLEAGADPHASGGDLLGSVFYAACRGGSVTIVRSLLDAGVDCYRQCGIHGSPLQAACYYGNEAVVDVILEHHANVTLGKALDGALKQDNSAIAQRLIERGAKVNVTGKKACRVLHRAAGKGEYAMVRLLLEQGVDPNSSIELGTGNALHSVLSGLGNEGLDQSFFGFSMGWETHRRQKPIWDEGHVAVAKLLIDTGVDMKEKAGHHGRTPLHVALEKESSIKPYMGFWPSVYKIRKIERMSFEQDADVDAIDNLGETPLLSAALEKALSTEPYKGSPDAWASVYKIRRIARILLQQGADVDAVDNLGETPLISAAKAAQSHFVQLLLDHGANINHEDSDGQTPLSWARWRGHTKTVAFLLLSGADATIRDRFRKAPCSIAAMHGPEKGSDNAATLLDDHERQ